MHHDDAWVILRRCVAPSGSFVMSTLTSGGFDGGGVAAF
jgi:hypothetical protein